MSAPKDDRMVFRLSSDQGDLIREAAQVEGRTVTDFALAVLVERAQDVLADQRVFRLTGARWAELTALLDQPATVRPRLREAMEHRAKLGIGE